MQPGHMYKIANVLLIDDGPITIILSKKILLQIEPRLKIDTVGDGEGPLPICTVMVHPS